MAAEPSAKRIKLDSSGDIAVLVGPDEHRFTVHESILISYSEFFRAALSQDWKEAKERQVKPPGADPETFSTYMLWAYTK